MFNKKGFIRLVVDANLNGKRLDVILSTVMSRRNAKRLITAGAVFVNKKRVKIASRTIEKGSIIVTPEFLPKLPKIDWTSLILFENNEIIAVNKPDKVASAPTLWGESGVLSVELAKAIGINRLYIIHRLDFATSGVILYAKSKQAALKYEKILKSPDFYKIYLAVSPKCSLHKGKIELNIAKSKRFDRFYVHNKGKKAITEILDTKDFKDFNLIKIKLHTGRTHQIRVHLAHLGCGILGDPWYGDNANVFLENFSTEHMYLHAWKLGFLNSGDTFKIDNVSKNFEITARFPQYWNIEIPPEW